MCTLTWWRDEKRPENFSVFFNRDESKLRPEADPPREFQTDNGTRYLAPIDPQAGGSWMFVNQFGFVLCLLNWYDKAVPDLRSQSGFESRGLLVTSLAATATIQELKERLAGMDLKKYRPFHLLGFSPKGEAGWSWDGDQLFTNEQGTFDEPTLLDRNDETNKQGSFDEPTLSDRDAIEQTRRCLSMPVSSSSFETERVLEFRREFLGLTNPQNPDEFWGYHENFGQPATAVTPRMNRPDAQTWSRSRVDVSASEVQWLYLAESADQLSSPDAFRASIMV